MNKTCTTCHYRFERDPGYFLGSTYINYGATTLITTLTYTILMFGFEIDNRYLFAPLVVFIVLFPLLFFRHARSFWMAIDVFFDRSVWTDKE